MEPYGFTLSEIDDIENSKCNMNAHYLFWDKIGSISDTPAFAHVRKNMPTTFEKYGLDLFSSYFEEALSALYELKQGFFIQKERVFKMRMYMKAEYQIITLYEIYKIVSTGVGEHPPLARKILVNIPGFTNEDVTHDVGMQVSLIPVSENKHNVSGNSWVVSTKIVSNTKTSTTLLNNTSRRATGRDIMVEPVTKEMGLKSPRNESDITLEDSMHALTLLTLKRITQKINLTVSLDWKVTGKVAMLKLSMPDASVESAYMNHMLENTIVIRPLKHN
jgi:hypothetical protein